MKLVNVFLFFVFAIVATSKSTSEEKENWISTLDTKHGVLQLNSETFFDLVKEPREYGTYVLFTTLSEQHKCPPCKLAQEPYEIVARSYIKSKKDQGELKIHLAMLDYVDGSDVFRVYQFSGIPRLAYYPPTQGPHAQRAKSPLLFDGAEDATSSMIESDSFSPETFARHIEGKINRALRVRYPIQWGSIAVALCLLLVILLAGYRMTPFLKVLLSNQMTWLAVCMFAAIYFETGHMWVRMRHPPFTAERGGLSISSSLHWQFGVESDIMMFVYFVCAVCVLGMTYYPQSFSDEKKQRRSIYVLSVMYLAMLSCLLRIYRIKYGGYPYHLF